MGVDVGHVTIPALMRPRRAMMALVPNALSATMLRQTIAPLLVGPVSRILTRLHRTFRELYYLRSLVYYK